jgi:transposase-like protein
VTLTLVPSTNQRAVDQYGQVIDVMMSEQRDTGAARRFFTRALRYGAGIPATAGCGGR